MSSKKNIIKRSITHLNIEIYYPFVRALFLSLGLMLLGYLANIAGYKEINFLFLLLFVLTTILYLLKFEKLAFLLGVGVIAGGVNQEISAWEGVKKLKKYIEIFLLWASFVFFLLATKSFQHAPGIFFALASGAVVLALFSAVTGIGTVLSAGFIYVYTITAMAMFMLVLVPGAYWTKVIGFNPMNIIGLSPVDETIYQIREAQRKALNEQDSQRLGAVLTKIQKGGVLSIEDKMLIKKYERSFFDTTKKQSRLIINCDQILFVDGYKFFSNDGQPQVWYGQNMLGDYEWFSEPGYSPTYNEPLKPVDKAFVRNLAKSCYERRERTNELVERSKIEQVRQAKDLENANVKILADFKRKIANYNKVKWVPKKYWKVILSGKSIKVNYLSSSEDDAALIISRLQRMGAKVQYKELFSTAAPLNGSVFYADREFEQAEVVQVSMVDIVRFKIFHGNSSRNIIINL